jgi:outer membrane lipoprotein-sorting protein
MGMRKLIIALLLTLPLFSQAAPLSDSETQDLIRRIQAINESKPSIEANFFEERHAAILKRPLRMEGKIWATLPGKIRREIDGNTPSATVIDGDKMIDYYPSLKEEEMYDLEKRPIIKDSLRALTAGLDFQQLNSFYYVEASKEGGYVSHQIDTQNRCHFEGDQMGHANCGSESFSLARGA